MPGRASPGRLRAAAFTLIEVLVVVLLIGIVATFAVLSIGNRALDDRLDNEARRLHELLRLAAEEAVLQGVELGFRHTLDGYSFVYRDPNSHEWQPIPDDPLFRARTLKAPFFIELRVEDQLVAPIDVADEETVRPQVLLSSSGEVTEFSLRIRARDYPQYFVLRGNLIGEMNLERKGEPG